jgi:hypothetical protein
MQQSTHAAQDNSDAGAVEPPFRAYLEGDAIVLAALVPEQAWFRTCSGYPYVQKRAGTEWVPMIDDRPSLGPSPGYYLGDTFISPDFDRNCDVDSCGSISEPRTLGHAEEYVKIGTKAPPPGSDATAAMVDVFEARPYHGDVRVVVHYSTDSACSGETKETFVPLTIPEDGVCCPVVATGCSVDGPRGGWATSRDACVEVPRVPDAYIQRGTVDSHGCAIACCGCTNDEDAGI